MHPYALEASEGACHIPHQNQGPIRQTPEKRKTCTTDLEVMLNLFHALGKVGNCMTRLEAAMGLFELLEGWILCRVKGPWVFGHCGTK